MRSRAPQSYRPRRQGVLQRGSRRQLDLKVGTGCRAEQRQTEHVTVADNDAGGGNRGRCRDAGDELERLTARHRGA